MSRRFAAAPARLRILGWILLTTLLSTVAILLTTRAALIAATVTAANADVEQEIDEFGRFAVEGRDPETNDRFASTERLLELHLVRQFPDDDEAMIGYVRALEDSGQNPVLLQANRRSAGLGTNRELVEDIMSSPSASGVVEIGDEQIRWGRADVTTNGVDPGGAFIIAYYTADDRDEADATVRIIALVCLGGLLLTVLIGWLAAGRILAPVRLVRVAAGEITEQDLTRRIPVHGGDDIAALAVTFNEMLDRLEQAFRTQRQFVDDAGHELRTPITIVRGHLELMGSDPAERDQTVRLVTDELDRMNRIVNDLLVLAKAERPDFVRPETVDVADLTIDLDAKVQRLADRRWMLEQVADGTAMLDRQRVTQAVLQLAQNAAQHTHDGAEIRLGSTFQGDVVAFWVTDSGAGVHPDDVGVVFERFAHGTAGRGGHERPGAGLGLAIVRAIATAHGGEAYLSSPPGKGATFGLLLPVRHGGPRDSVEDLDEPARASDVEARHTGPPGDPDGEPHGELDAPPPGGTARSVARPRALADQHPVNGRRR